MLPFSPTPVNTVSSSNYRTEPLSSTPPSASLKTSIPSNSIRHTPTQTEQQTTVPSPCEPTTPTGTPQCIRNACKNGGTCVIPGNYCKCKKNFTWHDCSVNVGKWTFDMENFPFNFIEQCFVEHVFHNSWSTRVLWDRNILSYLVFALFFVLLTDMFWSN